MGTLFMRPDLLEIYLRLGADYNLPVLIPRDDSFLKQLDVGERVATLMADTILSLQKQRSPVLETVFMHYQRDSIAEKSRTYLELIHSVPPGVSELIIHCGIDDGELQSVMGNYRIRTSDHAVFTDSAFIAKARDVGVELVTWKQFHQVAADQVE